MGAKSQSQKSAAGQKRRGSVNEGIANNYIRSIEEWPTSICSSERTRETLERVLHRLPEKPRVVVETDLYLAGCESLLARLRALPDEAERVLLVGHHPGIADLAELLATDGPRELRKRLAEKFPTAALAILGIPHGRWRDAGPGARLEAFVLPRELEKA